MRKHLVLTLGLTLALAGCATNTPLSTTERSAIQRVSINPEVTMPKSIKYSDNAEVVAYAAGGLIGYELLKGAENSGRNRIKVVMQNDNIPRAVSRTLNNKFTERLTAETDFKLVRNGFGDGQFNFKVDYYGFNAMGHESGIAFPMMKVSALLINQKGNILWKDSQKVTLKEPPYNTYKLNDYLKNPTLMNQAFQKMSEGIAARLVANLQSAN